jgi:hypothetical protein
MIHHLALAAIRLDDACQPRAQLDLGVVAEYAEALAAGATFPPVTVFHDTVDHWLADGFHRYAAKKATGQETINAEVRPGTRRDAVLYSVGVNATHGLRRTNEDKRRAVSTMLADPEWACWSDREIARRCAVNHHLVAQLRGSSPSDERTYTTKHGTVATMNTAAIGAADVDDDPEVAELVVKTVARIESGEPITSLADLKNTIREVWREDHPSPPTILHELPMTPPIKLSRPDHSGLDTFGVIRAVARHAADNPVAASIDKIGKWTRLNILDDLPIAIAYLTELHAALTGGSPNASTVDEGRSDRADTRLSEPDSTEDAARKSA